MSRCRLSREQEKAIVALMTNPTVFEAAKQLKVHPNTLRNWLKQPTFARAYEEARKGLFARVVAHLQAAMVKVTEALLRELKNPKASVRLKAAELLLANVARMSELKLLRKNLNDLKGDIAAKLAQMERDIHPDGRQADPVPFTNGTRRVV
jgi:transposase-like protein